MGTSTDPAARTESGTAFGQLNASPVTTSIALASKVSLRVLLASLRGFKTKGVAPGHAFKH